MTKISRNREDQPKAKFEPLTLTPEQIKEMNESLDRFRADHVFLDTHRAEWTLKYPDRWVVVKGQKLVGYGKNLPRLYQRLRKREVDLRSAAVEFLSTKPRKMILYLRVASEGGVG